MWTSHIDFSVCYTQKRGMDHQCSAFVPEDLSVSLNAALRLNWANLKGDFTEATRLIDLEQPSNIHPSMEFQVEADTIRLSYPSWFVLWSRYLSRRYGPGSHIPNLVHLRFLIYWEMERQLDPAVLARRELEGILPTVARKVAANRASGS